MRRVKGKKLTPEFGIQLFTKEQGADDFDIKIWCVQTKRTARLNNPTQMVEFMKKEREQILQNSHD